MNGYPNWILQHNELEYDHAIYGKTLSMATFNGYVTLPQGIQNGWFIMNNHEKSMKNPIKMDELGVPLLEETSIK